MVTDVASARSDWEQGYRRLLEAADDPVEARRAHAEVSAVTAELRKRVGGAFTLGELVEAYAGSDRWAREAVAAGVAHPGWPRRLAFAADAAFYLYARGAVDYKP